MGIKSCISTIKPKTVETVLISNWTPISCERLVAMIPEPTTMQTKRQVPRNSETNLFTDYSLILALFMASAYGSGLMILRGAGRQGNEQLVNKNKTPPALLADGVLR